MLLKACDGPIYMQVFSEHVGRTSCFRLLHDSKASVTVKEPADVVDGVQICGLYNYLCRSLYVLGSVGGGISTVPDESIVLEKFLKALSPSHASSVAVGLKGCCSAVTAPRPPPTMLPVAKL
jgi:hypothetical protein